MIGFSTVTARVGCYFAYRDGECVSLARMLGRVNAPGGWGEKPIKNYILAMVLGMEGTHAFERWVDPDTVTRICSEGPPHKLAAFFFQPKLPYDVHMMRRLMEHGTVSDSYIEQHAERVAMFKARDAGRLPG